VAEIIGISDRQMRRWRERYEGFGFRDLFDRRRGSQRRFQDGRCYDLRLILDDANSEIY